jgi:hypothetical protein
MIAACSYLRRLYANRPRVEGEFEAAPAGGERRRARGVERCAKTNGTVSQLSTLPLFVISRLDGVREMKTAAGLLRRLLICNPSSHRMHIRRYRHTRADMGKINLIASGAIR